ncbi:hypothetical protein M2165_003781 [Variovorax sp. TBS-050B]|uniref:hypothetical protein n=1 Tax=Variovorax sp. TBS-050B TaxID=2940551 RepID=UPI0024732C5C|nr:hypothetical protein [Variovorax sp. TBS-050B]MDH6593892.1 hypothetical protein [Variovorax sp. TBS-050B]
MTGPYTPEEERALDAIEELLVDQQVSYAQMMKMYAGFLLDCISAGRFDTSISSTDLTLVAEHLRKVNETFELPDGTELRKPGRRELWSLVQAAEKEQPLLSALARCAVCCFYEDSGWNPDEKESPTPVPLYLLLLKRVDSEIGVEFLAYVRSCFNL